jgi:hypothetical protein
MQPGSFGPSSWALIMSLFQYDDHDLCILLLRYFYVLDWIPFRVAWRNIAEIEYDILSTVHVQAHYLCICKFRKT